MPRVGPIKRRDLIQHLRTLGFTVPHPRAKHEIMRKENNWVLVPNPHRGDIGTELLARIMRQAGISREEWEKL